MSEATQRIIESGKDGLTVRLRNVRLSFPKIFKPDAFNEGDTPKFSAIFLMPKKGDPNKNAQYVKEAIDRIVKKSFKGKHPGEDRVCLRDGADKDGIDGYDDSVYFLSSSNAKRPVVVQPDPEDKSQMTPCAEEDGKPYAGCYVHATVRLWPQNNKFGKRVNAQLRAIMFYKDGEAFGDMAADPEEEFADAVGSDDAGDDLL